MHTANLRKVGGSVMLAVPPALIHILGLKSGDTVGVAVENGRLIVEPRRRRYTLQELLAQCRPKARRSAAERQWLGSKAAGREIV